MITGFCCWVVQSCKRLGGWFGVSRDGQNMEGKTRVNNVKMVAGNKERGKRNDEGKKGNGRIGGIGKA